MNVNEIANELKRIIWERQNGMCALTGKKFEIFDDAMEVDFICVKPASDISNLSHENIAMVWKSQNGLQNAKLRKYLFPYANFVSYSTEDKAAEIKEEIDEAAKLSLTTTDWKNIKNQIREITNNLHLLTLPLSQKNEFKALLISALENINQRHGEFLEEEKKLWDVNYEAMKSKVVEAIEFAKTSDIFKEGRERLVAVQNEFNNTALAREQKNELRQMLQAAFDALNKKQTAYHENFEMECSENYHNLKQIVENAIKKASAAENFFSARDTLIHAQNQIKSKVLKYEQKNELFKIIGVTFDAVREKFDEVLKLSNEEIEAKYQEIKPIVLEAVEFAKNATKEQAIEAREKLIAAQGKIRDARLKKIHNDELFAAIREVFSAVHEMSVEEREQFEAEANLNYQKILSRIDVVIVDIENAIDFRNSADDLSSIRTELQLLRLKKDQRNQLFDKTRTAFDLLSKQREKYNRRKFDERAQKIRETVENMKKKADRLVVLLQNDREILATQTEKLNILEENSPAKSSVSQIINAVNARIAEREGALKNTEHRVHDLNKELEKIHRKEDERKNNRKKNHEKSEAIPTAKEPDSQQNQPDAPLPNQEAANQENTEHN